MIDMILVPGSDREMTAVTDILRACEEEGCPPARMDDIRTAVREACLNAMEHGSGEGDPPTIRAVVSDSSVSVEVESGGEEFDIPESRPSIWQRILGTKPARGWGLFLVKGLADDVTIHHRKGRNILRMIFHFHQSQGPSHGTT